MMLTNKFTIINAIEFLVQRNYRAWTIGVTDYLVKRKQEHGNPSNWHKWNPDSQQDARDIETYFLDKGMNGGFGGRGTADYVYIFKS